MNACFICQVDGPTDAGLIDGSVYHRNCYTRLAEAADRLSRTERALLDELGKPQTIGGSLALLFLASRRRKKDSLISLIHETRGEMHATASKLEQIHDVWLSYPPDWAERRKDVGRRDGYRCAECDESRLMLHLHHLRAIREGGTHRSDNLVLLCEKCHSGAHGGKQFKNLGRKTIDDQDKTTAIEKRIALINEALTAGKDVRFRYKKVDGTITNRTVTPKELRKLTISERSWRMTPPAQRLAQVRCYLLSQCRVAAGWQENEKKKQPELDEEIY